MTRSTRLTYFCTAQTLQNQQKFVPEFAIFSSNFANFVFSFDEILSEFRRILRKLRILFFFFLSKFENTWECGQGAADAGPSCLKKRKRKKKEGKKEKKRDLGMWTFEIKFTEFGNGLPPNLK